MSETAHQKVLGKIFVHPTPRNVEWHALVAALNSIGKVEAMRNGKHHFTYNGQVLTFQELGGKDVTEEEIIRLRYFLNETSYLAKAND